MPSDGAGLRSMLSRWRAALRSRRDGERAVALDGLTMCWGEEREADAASEADGDGRDGGAPVGSRP